MSSPPTRRDRRRETRRQQFQQRQAERRKARERALRRQRIQRYGIFGGMALLVILLIVGVLHFAFPGTTPGPASGQTVDGITCSNGEMLTVHYHADLQIYLNGQLQALPAGVGIVTPDDPRYGPHLATNGSLACLYWLHTHDSTGVIHIESPDNRSYTLGQFFDIWGQPLSKTRLLQHTTDSSHRLVVDIFDASGHMTVYTGDPRNIKLASHETIVLLYNSPKVQSQPFNQWQQLGLSQ
jgi:hypothetical protein